MKTIVWLGVFAVVVVGPSLAGAPPNPQFFAPPPATAPKRPVSKRPAPKADGKLFTEEEIADGMNKLDSVCQDLDGLLCDDMDMICL